MSLNPDTWITEIFEDRTAFSVRYARKLYDEQSDFQRIEIYETNELGRVLLLNGCFMVTEKDAFIYHEMLVHPAMSILPNTETVLVVGGGDGGAVIEAVSRLAYDYFNRLSGITGYGTRVPLEVKEATKK